MILPTDFSAKLPETMRVVMNCPIETGCCICFPALCHARECKHDVFIISSVSSWKYCFGKFHWRRVIATYRRLASNHCLFLNIFYFRQLTDIRLQCSCLQCTTSFSFHICNIWFKKHSSLQTTGGWQLKVQLWKPYPVENHLPPWKLDTSFKILSDYLFTALYVQSGLEVAFNLQPDERVQGEDCA